jgi:hypothetical protein
MIAVMAVASFLTGFAVALIVREASVSARMSRSQEYMQRKVRYWMSETAYARQIAEQLRYQLAACLGRDPEPPDWPPLASG